MAKLTFEIGDPEPTCGAPSSTSKRAMHCEFPPGHTLPGGVYFGAAHFGRDRSGRWRSWPTPDKVKWSKSEYTLDGIRRVSWS